jgi:TonB family protein
MRVLILALVVASLAAQDPVDFRGWFDRGVREFEQARYTEAVTALERAVAIEPSDITAQFYLASAHMRQLVPGAESAGNSRLAEAARTHFLRVLEIEPRNKIALASMASLCLNQKKWDDAQRWYEMLAQIEPNNADAWYSMGFIAWSKWYPAYSKARADLGMRPEMPGPIQDAGVRDGLTARYGPMIESGLHALRKTLEINPRYDQAMSYMNLLIRERADLRGTPEQYKRDIAIADEWVAKALAAKKAKAEQKAVNPRTAVPPPPPPRAPGDRPRRITIGGDATGLLRYVSPVYPEEAKQAGIHGVARVSCVIDTQGHVTHIKAISGHRLLVQAAIEAVKQWEYKPTLVKGQPIEVYEELEMPFGPR